jgi:hypothetical protein
VLAAPSSARASLFARYGPSIGPRLALALSCERIRHAIPFLPTESFRLSRNDSIGSVVLAASSSARASLFARYGPTIGPRLALALSCERIRHAIPFLPTESFRLSRNDSIGSVVLAASSSARASLFARYGPTIGPRLALASSCERVRHAIPFLPTKSYRPSTAWRWARLRGEAPPGGRDSVSPSDGRCLMVDP